ncbi:glutamate racemase [Anaeromicropila populeti]|uniref:Glutamate racemase n=1 Tax=Anaeromicropila populeti TaxID=37658 RepID=A0A1I6I6G5_9FIRM|nr:glutamate racemase [Anaeromicropila populeti]SFR62218.1 glutamate racemase [Anaeromicropila populeti]
MSGNTPIGVFDSGVGGLTVAREIMRQMPKEQIIYFGDTARVPYGSKSKETIITFSRQIAKFLLTRNVKAIVVACNTASALALETIKEELTIPVIGVVKPGAITAAKATKSGRIGIIGTESTINSGVYTQYLDKMCPHVQVFAKACPLFVPLVEEGLLYDSVTVEIAERYLNELQGYDVDTLVLGCTHYPLIRHTIQKVVGPDVTLVNPAFETAKTLKRVLREKEIECSEQMPNHKFFVSDGAEKFKSFANTILSCDVEETKDINIEQY